MADDCLFCRIVSGDVPATKILETDDCVAFRDINPQAPVHALVIPKRHVASLNQADDAALVGKCMLAAAQLAREAGIAESGWRAVVNTNADAGQTVFHVHVHVLGGRSLGWPPG